MDSVKAKAMSGRLDGKIVLALAGGGYGAAGMLTRFGGMSGTILEARCLSHPQSTNEFIGGTPDKYVSAATARALAVSAFYRACKLDGVEPGYPTKKLMRPDARHFGIGVTCALKKAQWEEERPDRLHEFFIVRHCFDATYESHYILRPDKTREEQESIVARAVINYVNLSLGIMDFPDQNVVAMHNHNIASGPLLNSIYSPQKPNHDVKAILPSSCNPLHDGHVAMMKAFGGPVDIELCVTNVDKPPLDFLTIHERTKQVHVKVGKDAEAFGRLHITHSPLFFDKVKDFPEAKFLIGYDTFVRIANPKYYAGGVEELRQRVESIVNTGRKPFVIFPRRGFEYKSKSDADFCGDIYKISQWIGSDYTAMDISSTQIRKGLTHD